MIPHLRNMITPQITSVNEEYHNTYYWCDSETFVVDHLRYKHIDCSAYNYRNRTFRTDTIFDKHRNLIGLLPKAYKF